MTLSFPLPKLSDLALEAQAAYEPPWRWISGDVKVRHSKLGGYDVIAHRGTTLNGEALLRDMRCAPWYNRHVGWCPAGFLRGAASVIDDILWDMTEPLREGRLLVLGHSLGGAMALITAGWMASLGHSPAYTAAFEPPRCGGPKLRRLLRSVPVAITHDGNDPVCDVPWPWGMPGPVLSIGHWRVDPFACHRIETVRNDLVVRRL